MSRYCDALVYLRSNVSTVQGCSRRYGHGLTTISATNFKNYSLLFKVRPTAHPTHYMAAPLFESRLYDSAVTQSVRLENAMTMYNRQV